ncbi:NAD(P)/FAD-dependent oxidoreductase [Mycolicibacter hiberniae]|uniref:FAD-dependent oxidoreductase n=1 Tax=Mycolicibacter hiberniae TaxID=29314 RepID=A0A7I7WX13_9MYCO|nr:NAD(P)/FAD-dependent oxidoreductase [Mycolicibacter hiberniae]MCV7086568.1 NAD(P)/FAD-dependent oxidoreductase [Mycolicibacter hiberniae]ORV69936.1 dehydrogenase [Mycolicibacter hiberniae]BBZ22149.1 FAD-dependent oxidoreductase [Mycolicibacter hiberniae]
MPEHTDVVIVGSRCAGSAAAVALARRGRAVIALDSAAFPSDTLSTHLLFTHHWAEVERIGATERVLELGAPLHARAGLGAPGVETVGPSSTYEGFSAGACIRRPGFDLALVETARAAGAEVREHVRVTDLLRDPHGRVRGVRYKQRNGVTGEITAKLVIGADGRRSTVARLVGTREHHSWDNQRMMAFAYFEDAQPENRHVAMQWRSEDDLVTVFPCDGGQLVALQMPPVRRADEYRADRSAAFAATVDRIPPYAERLRGCTQVSNVYVSNHHPSYFRHSHGPGWALAGDAGHFKDPVTAQGIRDALRFGRLLGEAAAPCLDDPAKLDRALAQWELDRDAQCLAMYQWANSLGRDDAVSPIEFAAYRWFAARPDGFTEVADVFNRIASPQQVFSPANVVRWTAAAARDPHVDNRQLWRTLRRDLRREAERMVEKRKFTHRRAASARLPFTPAASGDRDPVQA